MTSDGSDPGYLDVPVNHLKGRQLRGEFSPGVIKRLLKSMLANGYNREFPIDVAEIDGRLIIIDGHHRARAAGSARIAKVPVRIVAVTPAREITLLLEAAEAAENLGFPF